MLPTRATRNTFGALRKFELPPVRTSTESSRWFCFTLPQKKALDRDGSNDSGSTINLPIMGIVHAPEDEENKRLDIRLEPRLPASNILFKAYHIIRSLISHCRQCFAFACPQTRVCQNSSAVFFDNPDSQKAFPWPQEPEKNAR